MSANKSVAFVSLVLVLLFDSIILFQEDIFLEEFCECHEDELEAIAAKCKNVMKKEVKKAFDECVEKIRKRRAPYKSIDGKYKQFLICDNDIRQKELMPCDEDKLSELSVSYDAEQNSKEFWECFYKRLLEKRKRDEEKEEKERPGVNNKKNNSKKKG